MALPVFVAVIESPLLMRHSASQSLKERSAFAAAHWFAVLANTRWVAECVSATQCVNNVQVVRKLGESLTLEIHSATRRAIGDLVSLANSLQHTGLMFSRPTIKLASSRGDVRALHADSTWRHKHKFDVRWLTADELATSYGMTRPAAIRPSDSAECDPYALATFAAARGRTHGCTRTRSRSHS